MTAKEPTVLIVEDNLANMLLATSILERGGIHCVRAASISEARAAISLAPPDLVLLDVRLPDGDGLELARDLKSGPLARTRVLALTANAMESDHAAALDAGCEGFISKPIDTRRFLEQVLEHLPARAD